VEATAAVIGRTAGAERAAAIPGLPGPQDQAIAIRSTLLIMDRGSAGLARPIRERCRRTSAARRPPMTAAVASTATTAATRPRRPRRGQAPGAAAQSSKSPADPGRLACRKDELKNSNRNWPSNVARAFCRNGMSG